MSGPGLAQGPMLDPVVAGASYEGIISVGDTLSSGYMFESILMDAEQRHGTVDLLRQPRDVDFVPFPYTFNRPRERVRLQRLHERARGALVAATKSGGVPSGSYAITSDQNFQRFCSSFLATEEHGFDRPMLLTNEEGIDW